MAAELPDLDSFGFRHSLRVRWAEADMQGIVFNGHYLTYFDIGITEYFRAAFGDKSAGMQELFASMYVAQSTVNYRDSARFDDIIEVAVRTAHMGNSSLHIGYAITRDGHLLVDGTSIYVHAPGGKPARIPDAVRERLLALDQLAGQAG